jgi:hypothetical protein
MISCTQSAGWNLEPTSSSNIRFNNYDKGKGWKPADSTI